MLKDLKKTLRHTAVYSLGNLSIKAIGLVLLPLYTSHLATEQYGALTLLEITSAIFVAVFSFKLSTSMMRWCSVEKDKLKNKQTVFTTFSFTVIIILFLNSFLSFFYKDFSILYFNSDQYSIYFLILLISASIEILNFYPLELIRLNEKSFLFIALISLRLIIILSLNIYFIVYLKMGIKGILLGQLFGHSVVFISAFPYLIKNMRFSINLNLLKPMLSYSFPLVFSTIAMMLLTMSDRYLIKYYSNLTQVGIYSLGYKVASVVNMFVVQSFQMSFLPIAYKKFANPEANRFFSKTLTYYTFIMVIIALIISLFSKEIIVAFAKNSDFYISYTIVPLIVFSFMLKGIQYVFSLGLHFVKKTKYNAYIIVFVALGNIGLNALFIPKFGIYGAAIATVICWIAMVVIFYRISIKKYFVNYEIKKIILLLLIFIFLNFVSYLIGNVSFAWRILIKTLLVFSFPFIIYPFGFYEKEELEQVRIILRKLLNRN